MEWITLLTVREYIKQLTTQCFVNLFFSILGISVILGESCSLSLTKMGTETRINCYRHKYHKYAHRHVARITFKQRLNHAHRVSVKEGRGLVSVVVALKMYIYTDTVHMTYTFEITFIH